MSALPNNAGSLLFPGATARTTPNAPAPSTPTPAAPFGQVTPTAPASNPAQFRPTLTQSVTAANAAAPPRPAAVGADWSAQVVGILPGNRWLWQWWPPADRTQTTAPAPQPVTQAQPSSTTPRELSPWQEAAISSAAAEASAQVRSAGTGTAGGGVAIVALIALVLVLLGGA